MTKQIIASLAAIGLLAGPAVATTNTKAPTAKTKTHKSHMKSKTNSNDPSKAPKTN